MKKRESRRERIIFKLLEYNYVSLIVLFLVGGYLYGWLNPIMNSLLFPVIVVDLLVMLILCIVWFILEKKKSD